MTVSIRDSGITKKKTPMFELHENAVLRSSLLWESPMFGIVTERWLNIDSAQFEYRFSCGFSALDVTEDEILKVETKNSKKAGF